MKIRKCPDSSLVWLSKNITAFKLIKMTESRCLWRSIDHRHDTFKKKKKKKKQKRPLRGSKSR